jgi:hypothetical protein
MTEAAPSLANLTDEDLQALLKRSIRNTVLLGLLGSVVLTIASGWRNGAMLMTGTVISAASIMEWQRLVKLINDRIRKQKSSQSAFLVITFFLFRLCFFGAAIYGSLKCLRGSGIALICGLSLAVVTLTWEALQLLRE